MRARRSQAWLLSFAFAVGAPVARRAGAQVPESAGLQLHYQAPEGCPDRARFEQRLRARLPRRAADAPPIQLEVRVARAKRGARGEIALARPDGTRAVRKLTARDCDEAVEALALVGALMLEPASKTEASARAAAHEHAAAASGARAGPAGNPRAPREQARDGAAARVESTGDMRAPHEQDELPGAAGAEPARAPPVLGEPERAAGARAASDPRALAAQEHAAGSAEPPRAPRALGEPADGAAGASSRPDGRERDVHARLAPATEAAPASAARGQPATRPARPPVRRQITLGAAALVATGVAPAARLGGAFALGLLSQRAPRLELGARLGMRFTQRYESTRDEGHVAMHWWSGSASLCAGTPLTARGAVDGCLAGELGRLRARGSETSQPSSSDRVWSALGPALLGRWRAIGPLSIECGLHALFPLVRHSYVLGDETVHSVPRLTFRGELGLLLQFP